MRIALMLALVLAACQNNPSKLDQASAGPALSAGGSGSASVDEVFDEMRQYTMDMVPVFVAWNGDCDAQVARLLTLEPLVTKIRTNLEHVDEAALRTKMMPHKDEVQKAIEAELAKSNKTMKDLEDAELQIKNKCGADPKFVAAMERVGVFKKRPPAGHPPGPAVQGQGQGFVPPANPAPAPPAPAPHP